jgi:hypothetical protein
MYGRGGKNGSMQGRWDDVLIVKRTLLTEWSWKKAKEGRSCLQTGHLDE